MYAFTFKYVNISIVCLHMYICMYMYISVRIREFYIRTYLLLAFIEGY